MMRLAPGGPFSQERKLDPLIEQALNEKYQLNHPLHHQYFYFLSNLLRGDLGISYKYKNKTVNEIIFDTLPHSMLLGGIALILALIFGITLGMIAALRQNSFSDYSCMLVAMLGLSLPTFVIGPLFQLWFAMIHPWFPIAGYQGINDLTFLVLPSLTLSFPFAARIARLTRTGMLDVLKQNYIRTARAKGLSEMRIIFIHSFKPSLLPVVSFLGPAIAQIMTGSLVVEKVFQIPGLGREFIEAAINRDYTLVMGTVIVYGGLLILCNYLTDFIYLFMDPKIRYS